MKYTDFSYFCYGAYILTAYKYRLTACSNFLANFQLTLRFTSYFLADIFPRNNLSVLVSAVEKLTATSLGI